MVPEVPEPIPRKEDIQNLKYIWNDDSAITHPECLSIVSAHSQLTNHCVPDIPLGNHHS